MYSLRLALVPLNVYAQEFLAKFVKIFISTCTACMRRFQGGMECCSDSAAESYNSEACSGFGLSLD